jgi:hypothetical protein
VAKPHGSSEFPGNAFVLFCAIARFKKLVRVPLCAVTGVQIPTARRARACHKMLQPFQFHPCHRSSWRHGAYARTRSGCHRARIGTFDCVVAVGDDRDTASKPPSNARAASPFPQSPSAPPILTHNRSSSCACSHSRPNSRTCPAWKRFPSPRARVLPPDSRTRRARASAG